MNITDRLNFDKKGLIPAIIQDKETLQVLTLCYMDKEAFTRTMEERKICVYRRSKGQVMLKGETSGCIQLVREVFIDCADNSVLFKVEQTRAACHKGYFSCYFQKLDNEGNVTIEEEQVFDPKEVYKD